MQGFKVRIFTSTVQQENNAMTKPHKNHINDVPLTAAIRSWGRLSGAPGRGGRKRHELMQVPIEDRGIKSLSTPTATLGSPARAFSLLLLIVVCVCFCWGVSMASDGVKTSLSQRQHILKEIVETGAHWLLFFMRGFWCAVFFVDAGCCVLSDRGSLRQVPFRDNVRTERLSGT